MSDIMIPRKGGPLDNTTHKCFRSVYQDLKEGQLFGVFIRDHNRPFTHYMGFFVKEVIYCLQKNSNGDWELVYVSPEEVKA